MAVRAYYLPANPASAIDASRPVSVEQLNALGWKISFVGGGYNEIEQAGRKLAQNLGYPVTQEGCIVPFSFDLAKNAAAMTPQMTALLMKGVEINNSHICVANGGFVALTGGSPYFDVEDVTTAGWVRIHLVAGMLVGVPPGAKYRVPFNEQNRGAVGFMFFKETISNIGLLVKNEIDNHPARRAYLNAQALGKA
ncbi:hypothetical protein BDP27DRAFT_1424509 [Rhodocollybia butyracea]|uniref:Uncharacterized protein n=1 Tax=Rhodocollybia butyracea TaxID=206335 RepID=A0A9P5U5G5_9AGAR|nr:hypothetical protein BDP27DRAFT_1424509 [Rhodocollybia butyracea]